MENMQRVNVFAEQRNGKTFYQSGIFPRKKTVKEIMHHYGLSTVGVRIYANSKKTEPDKSLNDLMPGPVCFLSLIYGETEIPKRRKF